jgi:hypothetical protein
MNLESGVMTTVEGSEARSRSETLRGGWLILARSVWVAVSVLAVGLFVASLPSYFAYLHVVSAANNGGPQQLAPGDVATLQGLGLSLDFYAWLNIGLIVIILLVYVLVGVVLFWRKSDDRVALLASLSLVLFPVAFNTQVMATLPAVWLLPTKCIELLGDVCIGLLFSLFPSGRFVPRWSPWLIAVWSVYWTINIFFPDTPINTSWLFLLFPGSVISLIALQIYRYRRVSTPMQRQQTKWVVVGIACAFGPLVIVLPLEYTLLPQSSTSPLVFTLIQWPFDLLLLLFPLSLGFAVLHYRLWDIDVLVNRTLVYGSLTILLGLIYVGLVFGFQGVLRGLIGQTSDVAMVVSTLAIAVLFHPLRRRIQRVIDRRFYRRRYDAARTLAAFSTTLLHDMDLATLREHLMAVAQETMQPTHVSLWLCEDEGGEGVGD